MMKNKGDILYCVLFWLLMAFLFLGLAQERFHLFEMKKLSGVFVKTEKPKHTFEGYVSGKYQSDAEKYIAENFGFREPVIRMYNQYIYENYRKTFNNEIYIGKDGWLYQRDDYVMYYGLMNKRFTKSNEEFEQQLAQETRSLAKINEILKGYGVKFLVFTLPTKSYIYPEHLRPHEFGDTTFNATRFYEKKLSEAQVPYINMTPWFRAMQDTIPFNLFYEQGSHWASGAVFALDSLLRYMEQLNGTPLAHLELGEPYATNEIDPRDYNLAAMLNLEMPLKRPAIYEYPVKIRVDENTTYPNVFFIGTSFYWYITCRTPFDKIFGSRDFAFYFQTYYYNKEEKHLPVSETDILFELLSHDDVVYFKNGPQLYFDSFQFFGKALISLCISDQRFKEKTNRVADSLMEVHKVDQSQRGEFVYKAKNLLYRNPEMFEELRGEETPECRNPRIGTVLMARNIMSDAGWKKRIEYVAKRDGKDWKTVIIDEAKRLEQGLLLVKDGNFFSAFDFFEMEASHLMDSLHISFSEAQQQIAQDVAEGEYDDSVVLQNALTFSQIIESFNNENAIKSLTEKAEKSGKTMELTVTDNAKWLLDNGKVNRVAYSHEAIVKAFDCFVIEHNMRASRKAIENIKAKAQEKNKPFCFALMDDVKWCYKNKN